MASPFSEAKKISIIEYLSGLGFEPAKVRGQDYWYHSPFRADRNPSFKVNNQLNIWYDHGSGEGGTILDLGAKLNNCSLQEFLEKIHHHISDLPSRPNSPREPEKKLEIVSANPLTESALLQYLRSRGIDDPTAKSYCKEVRFVIANKEYTAVGFQNRSGGYELRNRWFKGSSSPKDISLIKNGQRKLCVMEGFIDFLSTRNSSSRDLNSLTETSDFLILNSLSFLKRSVESIKAYDDVVMLLDNDQAGRNAKTQLKESGVQFRDAGPVYHGFKDINDFVVSEIKNQNKSKRFKTFKR